MITREIEQFLKETKIPLRLSCVTESGWPIVLSLWYVYLDDGKIHLATPQTAKVVQYLIIEPKCAFEIASDIPPYCGIRGQAKATINESRGDEILELLLKRYLISLDTPLAKKLQKRSLTEVSIELTPINLFHWNFEDRMKDSVMGRPHPCPSS